MSAQYSGFPPVNNKPDILYGSYLEKSSSADSKPEEDQENRSSANNINVFARKAISPEGPIIDEEYPEDAAPSVRKKTELADAANKSRLPEKNLKNRSNIKRQEKDGFVSVVIKGILFEGQQKNGAWVGKVTQTLPDGSKFYGELKKGALVGKITNTLPDGTVIHGQIENGRISGHCILENPDGTKKMGMVRNGEWVGTITWMNNDGSVYTGIQNASGEWVGKVKIKLSDGIILFGAMDKKGMLTGHVIETYPEGLTREGKCKNGELVGIITQTTSDGIVTTGVQEGGCWIGKTTVTYRDGTIYKGITENGKWKGNLMKKDPDGTTYSGFYQNGNWLGMTKVTYPDGSRFIGTFKNGMRDGSGTETFTDGSSFRGLFKDNQRDGLGTCSSPAGKQYTSIWRNGIDVPEEYKALLKQEEEKGESYLDSFESVFGGSKRPESRPAQTRTKRKKKTPPKKLEKKPKSEPTPVDAESGLRNLLPKKISPESSENVDEVLRAKKAVDIHSRIPLHKEGRRVRRMETKNETALRALREKDDMKRYDPKMTLTQILDDRSYHHYPGIRLLLSDMRDRDIYSVCTKNGFELDVILYRNGRKIKGTLEIALNGNVEYHKYLKNRSILEGDQEVPEDEALSDNLQDAKEYIESPDNQNLDEGPDWEQATEFLYSVSKTGIITIDYPEEDYKIEILPKKKELLRKNGC